VGKHQSFGKTCSLYCHVYSVVLSLRTGTNLPFCVVGSLRKYAKFKRIYQNRRTLHKSQILWPV